MKQLDTKPFIELLKRAVKSGYGKQVILHNRMFLGFYDPTVDDDTGFHYTLFIPDKGSYEDAFYDSSMVVYPDRILSAYNEYANELTEKRKGLSLKPADATIVTSYSRKDGVLAFTFIYKLKDEVLFTSDIKFSSEIDEKSYTIETLVTTYQKLVDRIDPTFRTIVIDGLQSGFLDIALQTIRIHYVKLRIDDIKIVKVPLIQSMLNGNKKLDEFKLTVNKTFLPNIYVYTLCYTVKGFTECFISYIQSF